MVIFIAAMLLVLGWRQNKEAEELDEMEQTAQDYSIEVMDPNPECTDPDEWKVCDCRSIGVFVAPFGCLFSPSYFVYM